MVPLATCVGQVMTPEQAMHQFGWPCHHGGSAGTQQMRRSGHLVNCMIFYNPPGSPRLTDYRLRDRMGRLYHAISSCEVRQPRFEYSSSDLPIDLSTLAYCIHQCYPEDMSTLSFRGQVRFLRLRGIAVIPCLPPERPQVEGLGFTLKAPGGQMIDLRRDGIAMEDLNVGSLSICYIAMMSSVKP